MRTRPPTQSTQRRVPETLRGIMTIAAGAWLAALALAALPGGDPIYNFFAAICHQIPERSWFLAGAPLAVCVRCTSIYGGVFAGLLFCIPASTGFLRTAIGLTLVEVAAGQLLFDLELARAFSGLLLGLSSAGFIHRSLLELLSRVRVPEFGSVAAPPGGVRQ